jgi:hypothetical protein
MANATDSLPYFPLQMKSILAIARYAAFLPAGHSWTFLDAARRRNPHSPAVVVFAF